MIEWLKCSSGLLHVLDCRSVAKLHCCPWYTKSYCGYVSGHGGVFSFPFCCFTGVTKLDYKLPCILTLSESVTSDTCCYLENEDPGEERQNPAFSYLDHCASQMVLNCQTENFKVCILAICSVLCFIWHGDQGFGYKEQKLSLGNFS